MSALYPDGSLFEVVLASSHASPPEISVNALAGVLADNLAAAPIDFYELPPCLLLLLVTGAWCTCDGAENLPRKLREAVYDRLRYRVPLLGASMGLIYCSTDPKPEIETGAAVAMLCSNDFLFTIGHLPGPNLVDPAERLKDLRLLADEMEYRAAGELNLGGNATRDLLAFFPGYRDDRTSSIDHDLFAEILEAFGHRYTLHGASAVSGLGPVTGYQFANDTWMQSGLAIALVESNLLSSSVMVNGFRPIEGADRVSIDETADPGSSHWVSAIDGMPAAVRLRQLQDLYNFPSGVPVLGLPNGPDYDVILPLGDLKSERPVFFNRKIHQGDRLQILGATPEGLRHAGQQAFQHAFARAQRAGDNIKLVLCFPNAARYHQYASFGVPWEKVEEARASFRSAPLFGGVAAGEFGEDRWGQVRSNGLSVWVRAIGSAANSRAKGRSLLARLRTTAEAVFREATPRGVMQAALRGAIAAGSEGGQICLVDWTTGRILGQNYGHAERAPGSTQNWELALAQTNRLKPDVDSTPCGIPRQLKPFAAPVEMNPSSSPRPRSEYSPAQTDDILWLTVLTEHAIFVPDSSDPRFYNDSALHKQCNINTYFVIPLPGSGGMAIATLQIGLRDSVSLDRELFSFWISYGQKVGQALERAIEAQERLAIEKLTACVHQLIQRETGPEWTPESGIREFLTLTHREFNADYVHARVRIWPSDSRFNLIAPLGSMAATHQLVRPSLHPGEGTCQPDLPRDGTFTSQWGETQDLLSKQGATACLPDTPTELSDAWKNSCAAVRSAGLVPLWVQNRYEGVLAVSSFREYFFSERCQRLIRFAGRMLETILDGSRSAWERGLRKAQSVRIENLMQNLTPLLVTSVDQGWQPVLDAIREGFLCEQVVLHYAWDHDLGQDKVFWSAAGNKRPDILLRIPAAVSDKIVIDKHSIHYDATQDYRPDHWLAGLSSALIVPAIGNGQVCGVLALANRQRESPLALSDPVELQTIQHTASAMALVRIQRENRQRYEVLSKQVQDAIRIGAAGLFGSMVVHQLNSGLAIIQANLENLEEKPDAPAEKRSQWLQRIRTKHDQLQRVIQELVSRPAVGLQQEELRNLVRLAWNIVQPQTRDAHVDASINNPVTRAVKVDLWQMVNAITAVLDNALDAIGEVGGLEVVTEVDGSTGIIRIRNTGTPPPQEVRDRIFQPGVSSKGDSKHLGLGLALAHQAVAGAHGTIVFDVIGPNLCEVVIKLPLVGASELP